MMRNHFTKWLWVFLSCMLTIVTVQAQAQAPDELLQKITNELTSELKAQDQNLKQHPDAIYPIIEKILVPYVDWHAMSQWVIGRNIWNAATEQQKSQFTTEFKDLLIRTYASTLRSYNNQTIEYRPIRGGIEGKSRVQVDSIIREPSKEGIKVTYRMANTAEGWKVYDITIEGVSLLKGFHSQFSTELQQGGMDGLIKRLHQHNEKPLR